MVERVLSFEPPVLTTRTVVIIYGEERDLRGNEEMQMNLELFPQRGVATATKRPQALKRKSAFQTTRS